MFMQVYLVSLFHSQKCIKFHTFKRTNIKISVPTKREIKKDGTTAKYCSTAFINFLMVTLGFYPKNQKLEPPFSTTNSWRWGSTIQWLSLEWSHFRIWSTNLIDWPVLQNTRFNFCGKERYNQSNFLLTCRYKLLTLSCS